jgi:hypothetical protein
LLLKAVSNIPKGIPSIPERHDEEQERKNLTKSPLALLVGLILLVATKGEFDVDNKENVDGHKAC